MSGENLQPIGTYRERSPYANREFELFANKVKMQGKNRQGEFVHHIPLEQLEPDVGMRTLRNPVAKYLGISFGCLLIAFGLAMPTLQANAGTNARFVNAAGLSLLVVNLVAIVWARSRRFRAYTFLNTQGVMVIDIIEAGPEKANCRAFAELVSQTIKNLRGL